MALRRRRRIGGHAQIYAPGRGGPHGLFEESGHLDKRVRGHRQRAPTIAPTSADVGPRCARAIKVLPCVAGAPGRGHVGPEQLSGSCRVAQDPSQDPPRALDRARSCHVVPDRATKPGSSPVAHASRDEPRTRRTHPSLGPVPRRARLCHVVPPCDQANCTLHCTLAVREIEIARKGPLLARTRGGAKWVLQDSNRDPMVVPGRATLCQVVPMCATGRELRRFGGPAVVPGCARSCQVVTAAIAHSVAHSGWFRPEDVRSARSGGRGFPDPERRSAVRRQSTSSKRLGSTAAA